MYLLGLKIFSLFIALLCSVLVLIKYYVEGTETTEERMEIVAGNAVCWMRKYRNYLKNRNQY